MKICLGIISYLPDNIDKREKRIKCLNNLIIKINELFKDFTVFIIAQNWKDYKIDQNNIIVKNYNNPLGVTGARIELRKVFLESEYDYLIMLDDDCMIIGTDASDYIREIKLHPNGFGYFSNCLLKLFAISRYIYEKIEFPNIVLENCEGFEDITFVSMCRIRFPEKGFEFDRSKLDEISFHHPDAPSLWWTREHTHRKQEIYNKTRNYILDYAKKYNNKEFKIPENALKEIEIQKNKKQPVDIVITYVNNRDTNWLEQFEKYKKIEGVIQTDQTTAPQRYRDANTLNYLFRSIEMNCPWVNKVFLIVQSESQLPKWLNIENDKLKIVYHNEFIPEEFLPTFNTNVIHMNICNIKELSDNYILCNDDMFFTNKTTREDFFIGNIPCQYVKNSAAPTSKSEFFAMLTNNYTLLNSIFKDKINSYRHLHVQSARNKSIEKFLLDNYKDKIYNSFRGSRFRSKNNYTDWFYDDYLKSADLCINKQNLASCSKAYVLNTNNIYDKNIKLMCINDNSSVHDWVGSVRVLINFLNSKFPTKCSFELYSNEVNKEESKYKDNYNLWF